jgi:hypothetical protein
MRIERAAQGRGRKIKIMLLRLDWSWFCVKSDARRFAHRLSRRFQYDDILWWELMAFDLFALWFLLRPTR